MAIARLNDPNKFVALSVALNSIPNKYGKITQSGLFKPVGIESNLVEVTIHDGVLNIIPAKERGDAPTLQNIGKRTARYFKTLHFPLQDAISGADVQNRLSIDQLSGRKVDKVILKTTEKLQQMRMNHAITGEFIRTGALQGQIKHKDTTVLADWYTEFGITKKTVDFEFTDATFDVRENGCFKVKRHIEDNLNGEVMNNIYVECSEEFFSAFASHPQTQESFKNYREGAEKLQQDIRHVGFPFGGITFFEYRAIADGVRFITASQGIAYPIGTMDTFSIYYAPPVLEGIKFANTMGKELYAAQQQDDWNTTLQIRSESNPLPICKRPALLVELTMS